MSADVEATRSHRLTALAQPHGAPAPNGVRSQLDRALGCPRRPPPPPGAEASDHEDPEAAIPEVVPSTHQVDGPCHGPAPFGSRAWSLRRRGPLEEGGSGASLRTRASVRRRQLSRSKARVRRLAPEHQRSFGTRVPVSVLRLGRRSEWGSLDARPADPGALRPRRRRTLRPPSSALRRPDRSLRCEVRTAPLSSPDFGTA